MKILLGKDARILKLLIISILGDRIKKLKELLNSSTGKSTDSGNLDFAAELDRILDEGHKAKTDSLLNKKPNKRIVEAQTSG